MYSSQWEKKIVSYEAAPSQRLDPCKLKKQLLFLRQEKGRAAPVATDAARLLQEPGDSARDTSLRRNFGHSLASRQLLWHRRLLRWGRQGPARRSTSQGGLLSGRRRRAATRGLWRCNIYSAAVMASVKHTC